MAIFQRMLFVCVLVFPGAARADVAEGVDAFGRARYADARKELAGPAEAFDSQAMVYMSEMLMRGLGGSRDELKARDYITRSHAAGNARATYLLGTMHLAGNLVERPVTNHTRFQFTQVRPTHFFLKNRYNSSLIGYLPRQGAVVGVLGFDGAGLGGVVGDDVLDGAGIIGQTGDGKAHVGR